MSLQVRAQAATAEFQKLQSELSEAVQARERLEAQLNENELVKKEFSSLTPNNTVYKLVGPVLVKQDQADAKTNVDTRLEFIRGEITRMETKLASVQEKIEKKKGELVDIQAELQRMGAVPGGTPISASA